VNLQCDVDHPTQTLADLLWLRERFGGNIAGRRIAVTWAYASGYARPLSVPQGLITLLTRFGAHVVLAHPESYVVMPEAIQSAHSQAAASGGSFRVTHSMDDAFVDADAVYPKTWGPWTFMMERVEAHRTDDRALAAEVEARACALSAAHRDWICDEERMELTSDALYLHGLPASVGEEVAPAVMECSAHDVARQANKKLYVIMALLAAARVPDLEARLEALR
jgi:ornithine carbamoyltransferase